jgi:hypothetical protein
MNQVEAPLGELERINVSDHEREVRHINREFARLHKRSLLTIDTYNRSRSHPTSKIDGDRPRAATNVEHTDTAAKRRQQIRGRILHRPPAMRTKHALVVAMHVRIRAACHSATNMAAATQPISPPFNHPNDCAERDSPSAVEASGIARPARIYDLRSTFASNALAAGVTVFELVRVMGTSVRMIEKHYGALIDGAHAGIASRLDALEGTLEAEMKRDAEDGP